MGYKAPHFCLMRLLCSRFFCAFLSVFLKDVIYALREMVVQLKEYMIL